MVAVTEEHNHFHATPSTTIASAAPVPLVDLTTWRERWPVAARDLAEWSKAYPDAHARVRDWDTKGDRFETMVEWAIGHSYEDFNAFLLTRTGWAKNEEILSEVKYRPAMDAFLFLVRRSSDASLELVKHPNGFAWLESHPDAGAPSNDTRVADAPAPPAHKAGATTVAPANPASAPTAPPAGTDEPTPNRRARAASPPPKRSR